MKTIFYLNTCSTCTRILEDMKPDDTWTLREIKTEPVTETELEEMHALSHSYEALFSKRSTQIKSRGIDVKSLKEEDFKTLLLEHYTFLKRPVFISDEEIFIGSDKKNLEKLNAFLHANSPD